jgi:hypothetical protein
MGEMWNPTRWKVLAREIEAVKEFGALSGGWAWHFMSPPHQEEKHLHDHRDIDFHVFPKRFAELVVVLKGRGYKRQTTRFDDESGEFIRFEKYIQCCPLCSSEDDILKAPLDNQEGAPEEWSCYDCGNGPPGGGCSFEPEIVKVIYDLFVHEVETIEVDGYIVVEPNLMLTFYGVKHSSEQCVAVQAARKIQKDGGEIVKNPALVGDWGA